MSNEQEVVSTPSPAVAADVPQFATAEYAHVPGTERCRICGSFISGQYFRVNNQMACSTCAMQARDGQPKDSHAAFMRGLLLGCGAALLGLIFYAGFTIVTDFYIGYLALAVGWLVAKAITKGSNGMGGRRYQIAAVLLTYAAISVAAVPIAISSDLKEKKQAAQHQATASSSADDADASEPADKPGEPRAATNLGGAVGTLLMIGLASPFLELQDPVHGLIGLVILFVGLRIAWRLTGARPLEVDGPYSVTAG
jgi:predicted lipid-binding transport protein (Tim44 family)